MQPLPSEPDELTGRLMAEVPGLVRLATRLVHDPVQAEDCAQEVILRAWRQRGSLRDAAALRAWLRRSLVNRIIDRELDLASVEAAWRDDGYSVQPEAVIERAELHEELEDALARLPVRYRLPVVLHDAMGWSGPEIAAAMGLGLPATKQRLRRGRMMLVTALARADERRVATHDQPMRCWRARRHVSAYLDGELDPGTRVSVEAHLASCPTCPPLYAALVGVRATIGGLRDPDSVVEEAVAARIRDRLGGLASTGRARQGGRGRSAPRP
jgi:RNA polymerase sigma factor (sigma-70 family)